LKASQNYLKMVLRVLKSPMASLSLGLRRGEKKTECLHLKSFKTEAQSGSVVNIVKSDNIICVLIFLFPF
jgi:hypothetical protein